MKKKIVSISFLFDGQRIRIGSDSNGKFPLPKIRKKRNYNDSLSYMHPYTAKEFVEHSKVKYGDPVITMSDGSKMRVYWNADPTGPVAETQSLIDNHDNSCEEVQDLLDGARKKFKLKAGKKTIKSNKSTLKSKSSSIFSSDPLGNYGFDFPDWGQDDGYDNGSD